MVELSTFVLNLILCALFVFESYFPENYYISKVDTLFTIALIFEFLLRLYGAPNRKKHLLQFCTIIDIFSILPTLIRWFFPVASVGLLTSLRILRLFRVLRFLRFLETKHFFFGTVAEQTLRIARLIVTVGMLFFVSAGVVYSVEAPFNGNMNTFGDAFYFAVMTLTTVGFGDISPITEAGRMVTILMVLAGVVIIPWQAGMVIHGYGKNDIICPNCGLRYHERDASHCRSCGSIIFQLEES